MPTIEIEDIIQSSSVVGTTMYIEDLVSSSDVVGATLETEDIIQDYNPLAGLFLSLSDTLTIADTIGKECRKNILDTITITDSLANAFGKTLSDNIEISDIITKAVGKSLDDTINISDSLDWFRFLFLDPQLTTGLTLTIQLEGGAF